MTTNVALAPASELDVLLQEPIEHAKRRERTVFNNLLRASSGRVVIYGAGNLGRRILTGLRETGIEVLAFADRNPAMWSQTVDGMKVLSPQDAAGQFGSDDLFLTAVWHPTREGGMQSVLDGLRALGCRHVTSFVPLFWRDAARYLPNYLWDRPHRILENAERVRAGFQLFEGDEHSQCIYAQQVRLRLHGDFSSLSPPAAHEQYFPAFFRPVAHEQFIDCGAFDGDTVRAFLKWSGGSFERIVAFEPDPGNIEVLRRLAETHFSLPPRLEIRKVAVSDTAERRRFAATGSSNAAFSEAGEIEVQCDTLDNQLRNGRATFLKMDIEGAEISALQGAREIISRDRPILAICAYHLQSHLWEVPQLISGLLDQARLSLGSYSADGWETVCYAIPEERLQP